MGILLTVLAFFTASGTVMGVMEVYDRRNPPAPPPEEPVYDPAFARTGEYDPYWERR